MGDAKKTKDELKLSDGTVVGLYILLLHHTVRYWPLIRDSLSLTVVFENCLVACYQMPPMFCLLSISSCLEWIRLFFQ